MATIKMPETLLPLSKPLRVDDTMRIYDPKNGVWWKYHVQFEKDCQPLLLWVETEKNRDPN